MPAGCAAGYFSRTSDGQRLDHCVQATGNVVAAAGALGDGLNAARECLDNSAPDASHAHCECKPGYYVLLGGVTPRCVQCGPGTFTDVPNVRAACKFCPIGKVATAARTGCSELRGAKRKRLSRRCFGLAFLPLLAARRDAGMRC